MLPSQSTKAWCCQHLPSTDYTYFVIAVTLRYIIMQISLFALFYSSCLKEPLSLKAFSPEYLYLSRVRSSCRTKIMQRNNALKSILDSLVRTKKREIFLPSVGKWV